MPEPIHAPLTRQKRFELRDCVTRWRQAVLDAGVEEGSLWDLWQGHIAYRELEKNGLLKAALLGGDPAQPADGTLPRDWRLRAKIQQIAEDVRLYQNWAGRVVQRRRALEEADDFLGSVATEFKRKLSSSRTQEVKEIYSAYAKKLRADRRQLLRRAVTQAATIDRVWKNPRSAWGKIKNAHKNNKSPVRESDLDQIFQLRVASVIGNDGISLATISRLVVLTYLIADLARDNDGHLLIDHSKKKLDVEDVTKRLSRAKID